MAFSSNSGGGPMADINVTPLVDVMLVLLIIFMVTAPALSYQIQVDLPQRTNTPPPPPPRDPPKPIRIEVQAGDTVTWNGSPVSLNDLRGLLAEQAALQPQPTLEIETENDAAYETLARVLARAKNAGMEKIAFVEPGA
ncbi:ExbD/TolR family protein [Arenimonas composti]|nr:biopolymer transporter ExbD [Arenimonas composti]